MLHLVSTCRDMLTRQMQQLQKCLDRAAKLANTIYQNANQCIATKVWFILMQARRDKS